jgi:hypothetical protein
MICRAFLETRGVGRGGGYTLRWTSPFFSTKERTWPSHIRNGYLPPSRSKCNTATPPRPITKPHNPVSTKRSQGQGAPRPRPRRAA